SLVKNDGRDISISGTGFGFGANDYVHEASVSLRESKGQIDAATAAAMGFDSDKMQQTRLMSGTLEEWMAKEGSGYSEGSGMSVGSGKDMSKLLAAQNVTISDTLGIEVGKLSTNALLQAGSDGSGYSTVDKIYSSLKVSDKGWEQVFAEGNVTRFMKATAVADLQNRGG
ncbi:TPA: flagellin, partial [Campylobacter jejuni]|nr:flagellin [Campylobacter jejuni]